MFSPPPPSPPSPLIVHHSYGKHNAEISAAQLDKYKRDCASPAVPSEEHIQCFCASLESHKSTPLITALMLHNDCDPLLALSPCINSMYSSVVMISPYMPKFFPDHSTTDDYHSLTLSPEEGVWSKIMVTHEKLQKLKGRLDKYQSKSLSRCAEHRCRLSSSIFGQVCSRLSRVLPESHCEPS